MKRIVPAALLAGLILYNFISSNVYSQVVLAAVLLLLAAGAACDLAAARSLALRGSAAAARGGSTAVSLTLQNGSPLPIADVTVRCTLENAYTGEKLVRTLSASLLPKGTAVIPLTAASVGCGKINCTFDHVRLNGLFGLIPIPCRASARASFTVLPDLFDVAVSYDLQESDSFDNEVYSPYRKGQDRSETFQIREYEQGDDLKQIHWKLSGKLDKLIVRDPSLPLDKSLMVVMDKSLRAPAQAEALEALAELTVSVCQALMDRGLLFRAVWNEPAAQAVFEREIQFPEEFAEVIPQFLASPPAVSDTSCAALYETVYGRSEATHIIYLSCGPAPDAEVMGGGRILAVDAEDKDYRERYQELRLY